MHIFQIADLGHEHVMSHNTLAPNISEYTTQPCPAEPRAGQLKDSDVFSIAACMSPGFWHGAYHVHGGLVRISADRSANGDDESSPVMLRT